MAATDLEDILESIGFGMIHWLVFVTAAMTLMMVMSETMGMGMIIMSSECELRTTNFEKSLMSNMVYVGVIASSFYWGYQTDIVGRKRVLLITLTLTNLIGVVGALMPTLWSYIVMRFVIGVFLAGPSVVMLTYMAEFCAKDIRQVVINYVCMFFGIAMIYVPFANFLMLELEWNIKITDDFSYGPWRFISIAYLVPGFIANLIILYLPETPQFLLAMDRYDEAWEVVEWLCKTNTGKTLAELGVVSIVAMTERDEMHKHGFFKHIWEVTVPLFKKPLVKDFLLCSFLMFGIFLISNGLGLWFPFILEHHRLSYHSSATICVTISEKPPPNSTLIPEEVCEKLISYYAALTYGIALTSSYFVLALCLKLFGRKAVLITFMAISGLCGLSLSFVTHSLTVLIAFVMFILMSGLMISVVSGGLVDLMPTHLRGKALCMCMMLGRFGAVFGCSFLGAILDRYCNITMISFALFAFACAFVGALLPL